MSRILIADDEKELVALLKDSLEERGHVVLTAYDGPQALQQARCLPDLILLDVMMPGADGFEVCRRIRADVDCPILFLSARQAEADRIRGLTLGGDDYLLKPFSLKELLARIDAHLRREARAQERRGAAAGGAPHRGSRLTFGALSLDLLARQAVVGERPLALTRREFDVVELLALHPGQVFSKEQIYERVWGYDAEGDAATVTEHVKKIRAKLAEAGAPLDWIATVWGIGYRWEKFLPARGIAGLDESRESG